MSVTINPPFTKNETELTVPSLSLAFAASVNVVPAGIEVPLAGAVSATVGGLLGSVMLTATAADVVVAP